MFFFLMPSHHYRPTYWHGFWSPPITIPRLGREGFSRMDSATTPCSKGMQKGLG